MKIKCYIVFFLLIISVFSKARDGGQAHERINVHLSEKCLFAGEELWVTIYVSNEQELPGKMISNLAMLEFVSDNNQSLVRKRILLDSGVGTSSLTIPDTIQSGIYYLMVYTNWSKNFGESNSSISKVYVFNPSKTENINVICTEERNQQEESTEKNVVLQISKKVYDCREDVELAFSLANKQLTPVAYSISVAPKLSEKLEEELNEKLRKAEAAETNVQISSLPDYKGILLSGTLINKLNNEPISNQEIVMSFPGEAVSVNFSNTDDEGRFEFLLAAEPGSKDIVFNLSDEKAVIKLDEAFVNGFEKLPKKIYLEFDKETTEFMDRMYVYHQLANKFNQINKKRSSVNYPVNNINFYGDVYQKVMLKDYTKLDSISEYFYELTPTVHFPRKKGTQKLFITNPETNFSLGDKPAIFIDGIYYPHADHLASLDYNLVEQINVIPKNYFYRNKRFDGIISIFTYKKNLEEVYQPETMQRLIYVVTDPSYDFWQYVPTKNDRIPDLRRLLYWEQNKWDSSKATQKIHFYTSDIEGDYIINVSVFTSSGSVLKGEKIISVQD